MRTEQTLVSADSKHPRTAAAETGTQLGTAGLTREEVQAIVSAAPVITVLGDVVLDAWLSGCSSRLAREAPVAVVEQERETLAPGGAANTAMNLAALGARVRVVGVIGGDETGRTVSDLLSAAGVDVSGLIASARVTTPKKTRIVVDDHILLRLDRLGGKHDSGGAARWDEELRARTLRALDGSEALVIADYGGHVYSAELVAWLAKAARPGLSVVDAHEPERWKALRPSVVTPNVGETERLLGTAFHDGPHRMEIAERLAPQLRDAMAAEAAVITLDKDGAVAVDANGTVHRTTAHPVPERQASGAGDTFAAGLTMAMLAGLQLSRAAEFAQMAANVAICTEGTSLCAADDLLHLVGGPRRTVLALGHFDLLRAEDCAFLAAARRLGDYLVVAVDRDSGEEGAGLRMRMQQLSTHPCVDLVAEYSASAAEVIGSLCPDVIAFDSTAASPGIDLPTTGQIPLVDVRDRNSLPSPAGTVSS